MRLSEFENEDALDLLANIIDPLSVIMTDDEITESIRSGKPKILIVKIAIKNHKKELVEIISTMHGETPETYKFNVFSLTKDVLDILNDPELEPVFTSQGQKMPQEFFGSAMENTEENEK